jgi:S1-C subfamily serine protease
LWIILAESLAAAGEPAVPSSPQQSSQTAQSSAAISPESPAANAESAAADLHKRADNGDGKAAYILGMRYYAGDQVNRNRIMAKHYLTRAAESGDQRAMNMLGLMADPLWTDEPKSADPAMAVFWYRRAATLGFESSFSNLTELKKRGYIKTELDNSPSAIQVQVPSSAVRMQVPPVAGPAQSAAAPVQDQSPPAAVQVQPSPAPVQDQPPPAAVQVQIPSVPAAVIQTQSGARQEFVTPTPTSLSTPVRNAPVMDGRDVFKARSSSLVEIIGDGNYGSGVILGVLWNRPEDAILRTAIQDLRVNYPFISSSGTDLTSLPSGAFLVIVSNAHVMEGTRVMEIGYGVDPRGQTLFRKNLAGVCFPTDSSVDLAIYFVPVENSELQRNGVISSAPLPNGTAIPETGSRIFALANPERMARSIAQGLLSGLRPDLIQFDAPISKGSSGGALFDEYGNLLGIIFGFLNEAGAQNLNFAIPVERIRPLMLGAGALCYRSSQTEIPADKPPQGTRQD